jgi:hypothetical protein
MSHIQPHGMYPCSAAEYPMVATACQYVVPYLRNSGGTPSGSFVLCWWSRSEFLRQHTRAYVCILVLVVAHSSRDTVIAIMPNMLAA